MVVSFRPTILKLYGGDWTHSEPALVLTCFLGASIDKQYVWLASDVFNSEVGFFV
jgi:hypothetical protein